LNSYREDRNKNNEKTDHIFPLFTNLTIEYNFVPQFNSLSLEQSLIKLLSQKYFPQKPPKKICSLIVPIALDLPWMMQGFDEQ